MHVSLMMSHTVDLPTRKLNDRDICAIRGIFDHVVTIKFYQPLPLSLLKQGTSALVLDVLQVRLQVSLGNNMSFSVAMDLPAFASYNKLFIVYVLDLSN